MEGQINVRSEKMTKRIAYEVEDLALLNEYVERVHDLFDGGSVVPPVYIEKVNIHRAQLFERRFHGDLQGFLFPE